MWSESKEKRKSTSQRADKNFKGAQSERIIKLRSNERVRQISSGINLSAHKLPHTHTHAVFYQNLAIRPGLRL